MAERRLHDAANATSEHMVKGWLLEQAAAMLHPLDRPRSQQILSAANDRNSLVTRPIEGIAYRHVDTAGMEPDTTGGCHLSGVYPAGGNDLVIGFNGLLDDLTFGENGHESFEPALMDIALHLGFGAQRPEKQGAGHLDVLWALGS